MTTAAPSVFARWRILFTRIDAKPTVLLAGAVLSLLSALFEGASAGLLIPTLEGALRQNLSFLREIGPVQQGLEALPLWLSETDARLFGLLLVVVFTSVLLKLACGYAAGLFYVHTIWRFMHRLKLLILDRYLRFGKRFFDVHNEGHLRNLLMGHPSRLIGVVQSAQMALYWFCSLLAYVCLMLAISWKMTLVVCGLFPLLFVSLNGLVRRIRATSEDYAAAARSHHEHLANLLSMMPLVTATNQQARERTTFEQLSNQVVRLEFSQARKQLLVYPLQETIVTSGVLLLVVVAAFLVTAQPDASLSGFLVFFYLLKRSSTNFADLNRLRAVFSRQAGLLDDLIDLLDDAGKPFVTDGERVFDGLDSAIRLEGLSYSYGEGALALRELTCRFEKGKTTAIVGRTGSGKTTVVSLLMRFYDVEPGVITLDGVDIREFSISSIRDRIAYVSQDALLVNDTIRANITYGLERAVPEEELAAVVRQARLEELIARQAEGLETLVGDRGVMVSGGEKQRIALARALLRGADVLILDEATSSLDTQTERFVQQAIDDCLTDRTAIVIAHRLSTIKNADWILLLEGGTLVEEGTLDELLARRGAFHEYWKLQATGETSLEPHAPHAYDGPPGGPS
jgi:subfamily B ATP-binding cassette protein MsbA